MTESISTASWSRAQESGIVLYFKLQNLKFVLHRVCYCEVSFIFKHRIIKQVPQFCTDTLMRKGKEICIL